MVGRDGAGNGRPHREHHGPRRQGEGPNPARIRVDPFFYRRAEIVQDFPELFAASGKRSSPYRERGWTEYGDWSLIVREVAGWDHNEVQRVLDWPLREVLLCYVARLKDEALRGYQTAMIVWASRTAMGGKTKQPELPAILRGN